MSHPRKNTKPNKKALHPAEIKAALEMADSSPIAIARSLKVSGTTVAAIIHRRSKSQRIAEKIAEVTGKSLDELFASDYDYIKTANHSASGARS